MGPGCHQPGASCSGTQGVCALCRGSELEALPLLLSQTRFSQCLLPFLLLPTTCGQSPVTGSPPQGFFSLQIFAHFLDPQNHFLPPAHPSRGPRPSSSCQAPGPTASSRHCSDSCLPESEGHLVRESRRVVSSVCMGGGGGGTLDGKGLEGACWSIFSPYLFIRW